MLFVPGIRKRQEMLNKINSVINSEDKQSIVLMLAWLTLHKIGQLVSDVNDEQISAAWFQEWKIPDLLQNIFGSWFSKGENPIGQPGLLLQTLVADQNLFDELQTESLAKILQGRFTDERVRALIGVNQSDNIEWFHKETFNQYLDWLFVTQAVKAVSAPTISKSEGIEQTMVFFEAIDKIQGFVDASGYQTKKLIQLLAAENEGI
jgi:hypothetical protein